MDSFNEYMIKRKKGLKEKLIISAMVLTAIFLIYLLTFVFFFSIIQFYPILVAGVIYLLYIGITFFNIEFEYSVTNGEIDIDKIISKKRRQKVATIDSRIFEFFAPCSEKYQKEFNDSTIERKIDASSNQKNGKEYFAVYYGINNKKTLVVFEPTEKMIDDFERYSSRRVFHRI